MALVDPGADDRRIWLYRSRCDELFGDHESGFRWLPGEEVITMLAGDPGHRVVGGKVEPLTVEVSFSAGGCRELAARLLELADLLAAGGDATSRTSQVPVGAR